MNIFPSEEDVTIATDLLINRYNISTQLVGKLFGLKQRNQANKILNKLEGRTLTRFDITKLLVLRYGPELFGGSDRNIKELRIRLLQKLQDIKINELFEEHVDGSKNFKSVSRRRRHLSGMKWHPNGPWPRHFVTALGFPTIFAGVRQRETAATVEKVQPKTRPPNLKPFQEELKKQMLDVINQNGKKTRCVVTLPTGGGKTRVAVEAFIDWMHERFCEGKYLVWVAQSEELCEQALVHIKDMWQAREYVSPLDIYRYFGGRKIHYDSLNGGAVVTSIQQLYNRIKSQDSVLDEILQNTGVMIIDEAHRAISTMYDGLFKRACELCGKDLFPICGLTATPGRSGLHRHIEIKKLVDRFDTYLIKPSLGLDYEHNPLKFFREERYLASPRHIIRASGRDYELTEQEIKEMRKIKDLPPGFLKRLAIDDKRNLRIIERLLRIERGFPTIVYACTVEHADFLSVILNEKGRQSGSISAQTPLTIRRGLIESFRKGDIDFLFNFGVLTTGFDAPKTKCIVICRPTTSEVLYEQIVGRGMRGPEFGGTETCDVIDFSDNILRLGGQMAYTRFEDFWCGEITE